jgi:beta-phosphoglucomutase-like phosphatase (HAD superfamily)
MYIRRNIHGKNLSEHWRAIVFDLDGVLVNSMPFYYKAWTYGLGQFSVPISREDVYIREGERMEVTAEAIFTKHKKKKPLRM